MARGKLFEYAILYHPKEKKAADGTPLEDKKSILVVEPARVIAVDEKEVAIKAAKAIPNEYDDKLAEVEIIVRPF